MILENKSPAELGIDILYVGVAIASVAIGLGIFIRLAMHKKVEEVRDKD
jgi:NADH:ubiquinone oxidoreductase subunit K